MIAKKGDSPAFPSWCPETMNGPELGMSLRDYFAAKAMQGICSHVDTWGLATSPRIARAAYEVADAMLAERAK